MYICAPRQVCKSDVISVNYVYVSATNTTSTLVCWHMYLCLFSWHHLNTHTHLFLPPTLYTSVLEICQYFVKLKSIDCFTTSNPIPKEVKEYLVLCAWVFCPKSTDIHMKTICKEPTIDGKMYVGSLIPNNVSRAPKQCVPPPYLLLLSYTQRSGFVIHSIRISRCCTNKPYKPYATQLLAIYFCAVKDNPLYKISGSSLLTFLVLLTI